MLVWDWGEAVVGEGGLHGTGEVSDYFLLRDEGGGEGWEEDVVWDRERGSFIEYSRSIIRERIKRIP